MKTIQSITFLLFLSTFSFSQSGAQMPKTGMLVLGSANMETLKTRVDLALQLYSLENIEYIIVSGGCDAHQSGICEATEMADILIEKGVPAGLIFKEEKSQSTSQNYCYSRLLSDKSGKKIMQKGDTVFVVSNHWHAFSVAGCLIKNDKVNARYYIGGNILPNETDKLDYGGLYRYCTEDANFCESILK